MILSTGLHFEMEQQQYFVQPRMIIFNLPLNLPRTKRINAKTSKTPEKTHVFLINTAYVKWKSNGHRVANSSQL